MTNLATGLAKGIDPFLLKERSAVGVVDTPRGQAAKDRRREFFSSPSGRIATITFGFSIAAAGAVAMMGASSTMLAIPLVILACIVGSIFATGLAIERFSAEALAMILVLPFVSGFYFAGLHVIAGGGTGVGLLLLGLGGTLALMGARGFGGK